MELILIPIVALIIGVVIGAAIIMLATKLVGGFSPSFGSCALAAVAATIAGGIVSYVVQMVLGAGGISGLVCLVVIFLLYAAIINLMVKPPGGGQMGFGKAALVTLVVIVIEFVLAVALFFLFGAAIFAVMGGAH